MTNQPAAVSDPSVTTKMRQRTPWKVVLPLIAVTITLMFYRLDARWMIGAGKWDDLPVTSAQGLSALMNGPVSGLFGFRGPVQLIFIGISWAWVGWLVDRRLAGIATPVLRLKWLRRTLYALGFALGAFLLWHALAESQFNRYCPWLLNRALWRSPKAHLLGREISTLGGAVWGAIYLIYFGSKLLGLSLRRPSRPTTTPANTSHIPDPQSP